MYTFSGYLRDLDNLQIGQSPYMASKSTESADLEKAKQLITVEIIEYVENAVVIKWKNQLR